MSSLPMLVRNVRFGTALGASYKLDDHIQKQIPDSYTGLTMQKMVEDLAKKYGVTRREADEFVVQSHLKWKAGNYNKPISTETARKVSPYQLDWRWPEVPTTFKGGQSALVWNEGELG